MYVVGSARGGAVLDLCGQPTGEHDVPPDVGLRCPDDDQNGMPSSRSSFPQQLLLVFIAVFNGDVHVAPELVGGGPKRSLEAQ